MSQSVDQDWRTGTFFDGTAESSGGSPACKALLRPQIGVLAGAELGAVAHSLEDGTTGNAGWQGLARG